MLRTDCRIALGLYRSGHDRRLLEGALERGVHELDTSSNYRAFGSHRKLAAEAGDLLAEFTISTKVGYLPGLGAPSTHTLSGRLLRLAVERAVDELGVAPAVVLLHNPEASLEQLPLDEAAGELVEACQALRSSQTAGLCQGWGIASWRPASLEAAVETAGPSLPRPDVLMLRCGLLAGTRVLHSAERLFDQLNLPATGRWGMSPFGGSTTTETWRQIDSRLFLTGNDPATPLQAAFRVAAELPAVSRIAVGTGQLHHLEQLISAADLVVDPAKVAAYRALLAASAGIDAPLSKIGTV